MVYTKDMDHKATIQLYRAFYVIGDDVNLKILYELEQYGEKTFSQLRDTLSVNPATLSKRLKILVRFGFVSADKTHDRLRVYYSLHQNQKAIGKILAAIEKLSTELDE